MVGFLEGSPGQKLDEVADVVLHGHRVWHITGASAHNGHEYRSKLPQLNPRDAVPRRRKACDMQNESCYIESIVK